MMIGDSLSRYMYLTLAHFLSTGAWELDKTLKPVPPGSICHEKSFIWNRSTYNTAWQIYYRESNSRIRGHGNEVCDCYRVDCCSDDASAMTENRYTHLDGGGRLTFLNQLANVQWRLHGHIPPAATWNWSVLPSLLSCAPGECSSPSKWAENLTTFARSMLPMANVTDAVLNWGHHWSPDQAPAETDAIFAGIASAMGKGGKGAWWRTTTVPRRGNMTLRGAGKEPRPLSQPAAVASARRNGLHVLDFLEVTSQLRALPPNQYSAAFASRFDDVHYSCSVYRELNYILLNAICALDRCEDCTV